MSTVKIKTEPTTTTAVAAVDVKVKLEPSLSTAGIKLEQLTSDIDTKVESESEADSEDSDIKSESDDDDGDDSGDGDQNQFTIAPKTQRQFICKHPGCGRGFNSAKCLRRHQPVHMLQVERFIFGKRYTMARQSLEDRWPCPVPDCISTVKTVNAVYDHIRRGHSSIMEQHKQQQPRGMVTQYKLYFADVDSFYVNGIRCGYHNTTGVFICHECKLVPECLLTHLQQKHGYDEKSIGNSALPESVVNANADPSVNQHTNNPLVAAAIRRPRQQHHQNIVQGWLCITSDCGYCCSTKRTRNQHNCTVHQGVQFSTVPALVLRLAYTKTYTACFLITRIDQASDQVTTSNNRMNMYKLDCSHSGLSSQDEDKDDINQDDTTELSSQKRQWRCEFPDCERFFNSAAQRRTHWREHKLEVEINVDGNTFTLSRQSSNDRWACPVSDCDTLYNTVAGIRYHILKLHSISLKHKRANSEDDDNQQLQQQQRRQHTAKKQRIIQYLKVDGFYISGTRCGYHTTTALFLCYKCRLVPECLLTHLQQKHGYEEKLIDSSALPESAVNASANPNINQHTKNSHLAAAISRPHWQHHQDIVQGWLCATSDCGCCGYTAQTKSAHKRYNHQGEQIPTVPALVLRLPYANSLASCFLITRLNTSTDNCIEPTNSTTQYNSECDDDGDELVLSDYSDYDDIN